nr:hypothetical protein [Oceanococcus sp. HetDA_MAG_MS8]
MTATPQISPSSKPMQRRLQQPTPVAQAWAVTDTEIYADLCYGRDDDEPDQGLPPSFDVLRLWRQWGQS